MFKPVFCSALFGFTSVAGAQPLSTAFTYQGELRASGSVVNGAVDLRFRMYDALTGGVQLGATLCVDNTSAVDGKLGVVLDFGSQFSGRKRFLEIEVRRDTGLNCDNPADFVILGPRQELTATPSALFALTAATAASAATATTAASATTAATATNATQLNGQSAAFYTNASNLTGTIPTASLSGSYSGAITLTNPANTFSGSGANLTNVDAATLDGLDSSAFLRVAGPFALSGASTGAVLAAENTSNATDAAGVRGVASATSGTTRGVYGGTLSPTGAGVMGEASTGTAAGVYGFSPSATGYGVYGWNNATTGITRGVYGQTNSTTGRGVYGYSAATTGAGAGVYGLSSSVTGAGVLGESGIVSGTPIGVLGRVQSPEGRAVVGTCLNVSGANTGVTGETASPAGRGVHGVVTATTGTNYGVHGESFAAQGRGVFGRVYETVGANYGVYGQSASGVGFGVYGVGATGVRGDSFLSTAIIGRCTAPSGAGVQGIVTLPDNYGVYGTGASGYGVAGEGTMFGVFSYGRTGATGTKSFRIDHPMSPASAYLLHYSAESDEVINFYSGKATLDARGEATVTLPAYFAAINKDPRYTLTAIGAAMPMLHIAEEIDEASLASGAAAAPGDTVPSCSFRIAGGSPGDKVSWRVDAVRNDRWVRTHGAPVEIEKSGSERGTYQHPELYGEPESRTGPFRSRKVTAPASEAAEELAKE